MFEALCVRILQEDSFVKAPAGIDGLLFLVKCLPRTQNKLIDFIRRIQIPKKGGSWMTGFSQSFVDASYEMEFRSILQEWVDQPHNAALSRSAKAILELEGKQK